MVIAQDGFRDEELLEPMEVFDQSGYEPVVLSQIKGECKGKLGAKVTSNLAIADAILHDEVKAILLIGGPGAPTLADVPELGKLLDEAMQKELVVGAICLAPMVLAGFGIIDGRHATVYPTEQSLAVLKEHDVDYVKEDVVVDGRVITANGPQAATPFADSVVEVLRDTEE